MPQRRRTEPPLADKRAAAFESIFGSRIQQAPTAAAPPQSAARPPQPPYYASGTSTPSTSATSVYGAHVQRTYAFPAAPGMHPASSGADAQRPPIMQPTLSPTQLVDPSWPTPSPYPAGASGPRQPSSSATNYAVPVVASSLHAMSLDSPRAPVARPARSASSSVYPTAAMDPRPMATRSSTMRYPSHAPPFESTECLDEPFVEQLSAPRMQRPMRTVQSSAGLRQYSTAHAQTPPPVPDAFRSQSSSPARHFASPRSSVQLSRNNSRASVTGTASRSVIPRPVRVNPALLSHVARAFEQAMMARRASLALAETRVFDGKDAVDKLVEISCVPDRNMALLLGRALDAQGLFHHVSHTHRLRDSEHELYQFSHAPLVSPTPSARSSFSSTHAPGAAMRSMLSMQEADTSAFDDGDAPPTPTGVFTLFTSCYSPTCTKEHRCYSITCPHLLEKQSQLVVHPSLQHTDSHESLVDIFSQLWAESVSRDVYESVSERERKRQEVIFEIISTERAYVQDLEYLRDIWMSPLSSQGILPDTRRADFVRTVFRNLLDIHAVNARLADMLTRRQRHRSVVEHIGDIFAEIVPDFEPYVFYGAHQAAARLRVEEERAINPVFAMFVEDTERKAVSRKLQVNGFLTKPTTRLARYPLLFEQMLKYTADDNMDKILLPKVTRQIQHLLSLVNDEMGRSENRLQLGFLSQQLQFKPQDLVDLKLDDPHRELVFKSAFKKRKAQSDSSEIQVYLFDHALLMVKIKLVHKTDVYRVYRRPIPLELLQVTVYEDVSTSRGVRTRSVLSRSSIGNRTCIGPTNNSPYIRQDAKTGYAITFTYLGKHGYSLTLWASTLAARDKCLEHIELRQQIVRAQSCVFTLVPVSPAPPPEELANTVTCAVPFDAGQQVFLGRRDGVYHQDLRDRSRPAQLVLPLPGITQMDVLEEYQIFLVLADQVVYTFTLDLLDGVDPAASLRLGRRIASHTSFFRAGMCLGRTLVCVVKSGAASSTIKTLEPIDVSARMKKTPFIKAPPGAQDTLRVFKEFYIPTESSSIHFLKSKLCIGTSKGFEIVDLETLDTQGLLDPADVSLEFVHRHEHLKPIAIFRIDGEFLLCYNEFAFYVNKNGWRAKGTWLVQWEGRPTAFALHYPYVLAFESRFVEVRHVESGALHQIITGYHVRCLFSDTSASTMSRTHHARIHKARTHAAFAAPGTPPSQAMALSDTSYSFTSSPPSFARPSLPSLPYVYAPSPTASPFSSQSSFSYAQLPTIESLLSSRHEILLSADSSAFLVKPHT